MATNLTIPDLLLHSGSFFPQIAPNKINIKKDLLDHLSYFNYSTPKARCKILHLAFLDKFYLKKSEWGDEE
ncbi:hypothetical protein, partial [Nostoc sp. CALU 546]|uniref:hypothetical protein n=1 Tax=Nostoc sp. CALU 546 TaxID=1867241 RepID=UPI003B67A033